MLVKLGNKSIIEELWFDLILNWNKTDDEILKGFKL